MNIDIIISTNNDYIALVYKFILKFYEFSGLKLLKSTNYT